MLSKDQQLLIASKYKATSTKLCSIAAFDLEYSSSDLLKELPFALGGDYQNPLLMCKDFIEGGVSLEAHQLKRIVSLARAYMCTITEVCTFIQMGTHPDGGWD